MKILIISADYPSYRDWLYQAHPGLDKRTYQEQLAVRVGQPFGIGDFYSQNLRALGHEAWNIHVGNELMQKAWAREREISFEDDTNSSGYWHSIMGIWQRVSNSPAKYLKPLLRPVFNRFDKSSDWFHQILGEQIRYFRPDVLINLVMNYVGSGFLESYKRHVNLLVGQIAWLPPDGNDDFAPYDLVLSSLPKTVEWFRKLGTPARMLRLGFEPGILSQIECGKKHIPLSFVGSLFSMHGSRFALLDSICSIYDVEIWGPEAGVSDNMKMAEALRGSAWGIDMFRILCSSQITLNHHIDVGGAYANNMRLYEATGVGTMLLTDWKENLPGLFEPGKEVVPYRDADECIDLIGYYLEHEKERETIARSGQRRTLAEHTYRHRAEELIGILEEHLV